MVVIHGKIWDHFWNFRFSLSQENWGQRRPMCEKVGIGEKENFSYLQGVPQWNGQSNLPLTDRNMQVRFDFKVVLRTWDEEF